MHLTRRRFQRERIRWREKQRSSQKKASKPKLWSRLTDWWNRRKFYKNIEVIPREQMLPLPVEQKIQTDEEEYEWNNESESDFDAEDEISIGSSELDMEKDNMMEPLETINEGNPLDDTMDTLETIHEEYPMDESPRLGSKPKIAVELEKATPPSTPAPPATIHRKGTIESISGSLESMDSIADSHWDPDDDSSNVTPLVRNILHPISDAFFVEHVKFLQVQTQPRKVEQVYTDIKH